MRIFTEQPLKEFIGAHPEARTALQEWASVVKKSSWTSFEDMQGNFANVSRLSGDQYSFGILGGDCQLIIAVKFSIQLVNITNLIHN